ncbi:hypothetical protein SKAU_G00174300 [Synaphobranchus kaupii]|uniref:Coiled-coil domain-containing protein 39 n=1 Tax=Synaphobranchus kaupii TaxID=118154 RepID=A0A9Q1FLL1_SYNKA|nr:hypothetical protein SKAU_G00174300 [Synaphobranchus kaupii]
MGTPNPMRLIPDQWLISGKVVPLNEVPEDALLSRVSRRGPALSAAAEKKQQYFSRPFMMSYADKPEDITKDEWMDKLNNVHIQRADMNRLIMNYLVTEGFKEAAEKFRMESGIEPSVDLDSLDERIKIREMILKGQIQEAIALINSLHPELLDTNRYLYFHLQQQHLIELIRLRETEAALEFAQTQLAEQGEESRECLTEMERTLALLAFDNPEDSPFGDLLNMMQRQKVWSEVNQAVLDYENRESTPKLAKLLKLLLWAQNELDQKKVKYPKMTDLSKGTIEDSNTTSVSYSTIQTKEKEISMLETKIVEHKQAMLGMVQFKNLNEKEITRSQSELHIKALVEREMGCLKLEIAALQLEMEDLGKWRNEKKKAILRAIQKVQELQREQAEGRSVLGTLRQHAVQGEEDHAFLMKCMQEDECRTVKDLLLRIKQQNIEARQRHEAMEKDWERTATMELEWDSTEETIHQVCKEREKLTKHWKTSVSHMTKRHQDMDQCIMSLSVVKEEVEERREVVKMVREILESLRRRTVGPSSRLEAVRRQADEMKAGYREREVRTTALFGECEILRRTVGQANTEVKTAHSLLAELTTDVHVHKDRLEKTRLHSAALEEKLKTEIEVVVQAKEEAKRAEQEVKKEEQARVDTDARLYGHQEVLSRKAEERQALKRKEEEQHAELSAGRGALSTMIHQQREMDSILTRKKEAVNKQDSNMESLERRMLEVSAGEDRRQIELLKEEAAQISIEIDERKRTFCKRRGEQQRLEGGLRFAKREAEKLASERQDLSCKVEDLELITAATERELSEITGQRLELMAEENLLMLEVKQASDRLQSEKDRIGTLDMQRLLLEAGFKEKEAELNLHKETVQTQTKQVTQGCQKTRVELNRQRCKVQKLQKKHDTMAVSTICLEGEEVTLQQYKAEVKRQKEELKQKKEDLSRKLAVKQRKVMALKNKLTTVRGHNKALCIAPKTKKCEERKALEQKLSAMQDKHAQKVGQMKELQRHVKGMNMSLDELLNEEKEELGKCSLLQDLGSEVEEEELNQALKLCSELTANIRSEMATDGKTEEEEDMDQHELQDFSETVEMLLLEVMDKFPDLRLVLQACFIKSGLTLARPSLAWDSQQSRECASTRSQDASGGACVSSRSDDMITATCTRPTSRRSAKAVTVSPSGEKLRGSIKTPEQQSQDTKPAVQVQGSPCHLTNHQHDSGLGSTDACCWESSSMPNSRDSSTPSDGSSRSSNISRKF